MLGNIKGWLFPKIVGLTQIDSQEQVILVDRHDNPIGLENKIVAHEKAMLHRAFSVYVFHPEGHYLLQRRAMVKYHTRGYWGNTTCGHPRDGESLLDAANRRLQEEMGLACTLTKQLDFLYKVPLDSNMWEHEFLHVFTGVSEEFPQCNPTEVSEYMWISERKLVLSLERDKNRYAPWFPLSFAELKRLSTR